MNNTWKNIFRKVGLIILKIGNIALIIIAFMLIGLFSKGVKKRTKISRGWDGSKTGQRRK